MYRIPTFVLFCLMLSWEDTISLKIASNDYYRYRTRMEGNHRYQRPRRHYGSADNYNSPHPTINDIDFNINKVLTRYNTRDAKRLPWWYYLRSNSNSDAYSSYYDYITSVLKKNEALSSAYDTLPSSAGREKRPREYLCPLHRARNKHAQDPQSEANRRRTHTRQKQPRPRQEDTFLKALDKFDRAIYNATYSKLPLMSFTQSGLFLYLILSALAGTLDEEARAEIEEHCVAPLADEEKIDMLQRVVSSLPKSGETLRFTWASRLILQPEMPVAPVFLTGAARELRLRVHYFNRTDGPEHRTKQLNDMVEMDSEGALRDTFDVDDVSEGAGGALLSTLYVRARWRAAPTLVNGTHVFREAPAPAAAPAPARPRRVRMLRLNDDARYARLYDWGAEAVELSYAEAGLTLLMVVPREAPLESVVAHLADQGVAAVASRLKPMRVAVTMPLYTLRMTLLLPNKLQSLGVTKLVSEPAAGEHRLWLSLAVQRVMFWSEAGRHAFKDDGIEWDATPDQEMMVDCPYVFFVRWHNVTLLTGNFLL